jgi:hypothetical protein
MATYQKNVTTYKIGYMSGIGEGPLIDCYDGSTHVAKLSFHNAEPLPSNLITSTGVIYLRYLIGQFRDVVDILRYEKPLNVQLHTPSLKGFIATSDYEPVGEQEG